MRPSKKAAAGQGILTKAPFSELLVPGFTLQACEPLGEPNRDLTCMICSELFVDPVQCGQGHMFCRLCISRWIESTPLCPIGRESEKALKPSRLVEVPAYIRNLLSATIVKCPQKCPWVGEFEKVAGHLTECGERFVRCEWCYGKISHKAAINQHADQCSGRRIACQLCTKQILAVETGSHILVCSKNPHRMIKCLCGEDVMASEAESHFTQSIGKHLAFQLSSPLNTANVKWNFVFPDAETKQLHSASFQFGSFQWQIVARDRDESRGLGVYLYSLPLQLSGGRRTVQVEFACNGKRGGAFTCTFQSDGSRLDETGIWRREGYGLALDVPIVLGAEYRLTCRLVLVDEMEIELQTKSTKK